MELQLYEFIESLASELGIPRSFNTMTVELIYFMGNAEDYSETYEEI